ncbi:MAG: sialidase family protein [Cyclobacteriaceae bacterium]
MSQETSNAILKSEFIYDEAPFPECHASTIEQTPAGMVAAWFGGTEEKNKDVEIWFSRKQGEAWTTPVAIANGIQADGSRHPCWNPVLYQVPGGELILFFKVGPNPREWWGEMKTSSDHGNTWSKASKLPGGMIGPVKNKPVMLSDGNLLCPSSTEDDGWRVHFENTADNGRTWGSTPAINDGKTYNAIQPSILFHPDNQLQILCRSKEGVLLSSWSPDNGGSWSKLAPSGLPNPNSGTDAVTLSDGRHILIYNHTTTKQGKWGGPRSPLNVAISNDGKQWHAGAVLESEPGEFSYPAVIQSDDGLVHIAYTWKRKKVKHVVLDPSKLELQPIIDGQWPEL